MLQINKNMMKSGNYNYNYIDFEDPNNSRSPKRNNKNNGPGTQRHSSIDESLNSPKYLISLNMINNNKKSSKLKVGFEYRDAQKETKLKLPSISRFDKYNSLSTLNRIATGPNGGDSM